VIGLLIALLAADGPPPQKPRAPTAREDVVVRSELVPDYFPGAGFTARVGMEWSFQ
jgi:hypothetical protein